MHPISYQRGLSLIELMIGLLLSSLLLLGVLQIFQSNSDVLRMQTAFSRVQESGRFAIEFLSKEIRSADYWGCMPEGVSIENNLDVTEGFLTAVGEDGVQGINDVNVGEKIGAVEVVEGTDILTLSGAMDACGGAGRVVSPSVVGELQVSSSCPVDPGQVVLVSNCRGGDLLAITDVKTGVSGGNNKTLLHEKGNIKSDWIQNKNDALSQSYGAESRIFLPYQRTFFIGKSVTGNGSLYMKESIGADDRILELVPGIEDMQIYYGRDTSGDGIINVWQEASSDLNIMADVTAIKLQLIVASEGKSGVGEQKITGLDGTEISFSDDRLRKLYVATVKIRNRGIM